MLYMCNFKRGQINKTSTIKPVLRGRLWDKEIVTL